MSQTHGMFDKTVNKIMWTVDIFYITENEMQKRHKHEDRERVREKRQENKPQLSLTDR